MVVYRGGWQKKESSLISNNTTSYVFHLQLWERKLLKNHGVKTLGYTFMVSLFFQAFSSSFMKIFRENSRPRNVVMVKGT